MIDNLMIIDDNDIDQRLARRIVNRSGRVKQIHSFLMAPDALEFLAQSDRPAIDAILLDINMPEMDGIEAIEGLREIDRRMRLRFITGGSEAPLLAARMIAEARSLSVGRNLYKPLRKKTLVSMLELEERELTS